MFLFGMCFILSVSSHVILSDAQKCAHDSLPIHSTNEVMYAADYVPTSSDEPALTVDKRQVQAEKPFTIIPFFDPTLNALSTEHRNLIQRNIIPKLVDFFSRALRVRGSTGHVLLNRRCPFGFFPSPTPPTMRCVDSCSVPSCGPVTILDDHLGACVVCDRFGRNCRQTINGGSGVFGDYILYVAAANQEPCAASTVGSQTIAFASHCQQESVSDRPVVGYINICPTALQTNFIRDLESTAKHEILHALGFSRSLYPFWRDENGNPRTPRDSRGLPPISQGRYIWSDSTIRSVTVQRETISGLVANPINIMVTPAVVREAKAFFNCPTLQGVEIENQGGSGSAASHWEKRILEPEGMTAQFTQLAPFTRLTFALLEDTGWYRPDYSLAEPMRFGKNLGCDFVEQSCLTWIRQKQAIRASTQPFCATMQFSNMQTTGCTVDRASQARCTLVSFTSPLPEQFRYFQDVSSGSSVRFTDFCPFYLELNGRDSDGMLVPQRCADQQFQPGVRSNIFAETFGPNSHCIDHGMSTPWSVNGQQFPNFGGSGCYQSYCTKSGLVIFVLGINHTCTCPGEEIVINVAGAGFTYRGSLVCPTCTDICWEDPEQCPSTSPPSCFGSVRFSSLQTGGVAAAAAGSPGIENFQSGQKAAIRVDSLLLAATILFILYLYLV